MKDSERAAVARVARLKRWRRLDAEVVVEAWRGSGLPLREWAWRRGIKPQRLARWVAVLEKGEEPSTVAFHPVRLAPTQSKPRKASAKDGQRAELDAIEIVLPDGRIVRVPESVNGEHLRCVLEVLEAVRC